MHACRSGGDFTAVADIHAVFFHFCKMHAVMLKGDQIEQSLRPRIPNKTTNNSRIRLSVVVDVV